MEILASLAYVNDLNTVIAWAIDDDIAGTRKGETAMLKADCRLGSAQMRMVS